MHRFMILERRLFYILALVGVGLFYLLFTTSAALSERRAAVNAEQYTLIEQSMEMQLKAALSAQKEHTLAFALAATKAIRVDANRHRILLTDSKNALKTLTEEAIHSTRYKQIRFTLVDRHGTVQFRSWGSEHSDNLRENHNAYASMLDKPHRMKMVHVDENTLRFTVLEPLMYKKYFVGFLEVSTALDTLVDTLKSSDKEVVLVIDKRYQNHLKSPQSRYFIGGYNIVNAQVNTPELLRQIEARGVESFIQTSLYLNLGEYLVNISDLKADKASPQSAYNIMNDYLLMNKKLKSFYHTDMAYLIYAAKRDRIEFGSFDALHSIKSMLFYGLVAVLILLGIAVAMRYLFIRKMLMTLTYDFKTRLPNKARLLEMIDNHASDSHMLVIMNINNFSNINIIYGFEAGDQILSAVGQRLRNICQCLEVFHLEADEFALLYDNSVAAIPIINVLQQHFYDNPLTYGTFSINLSFSYGVALRDKHIFRNASFALKQAKTLGSNRYHMYNPTVDRLNQEARERVIEQSHTIHEAIKNDRIIPFFQGIRNNMTGGITKFETLARVIDDERPYSILVYYEAIHATGMLPQITKIIVDKAFAYMSDKPYTFSINISEDDLNQNYLTRFFQQKLEEYDIKAERVIIEILEGVSAGAKVSHTEQLKSFKKMGMKLAIDDFGAEYSNFERVLDLDIDYLKIDAKYIQDIDVNPKSYEIAKSIVYFSKNSGIICIAEFVATEEIQVVVEELGIEYSQGFLYSVPKSYIREH